MRISELQFCSEGVVFFQNTDIWPAPKSSIRQEWNSTKKPRLSVFHLHSAKGANYSGCKGVAKDSCAKERLHTDGAPPLAFELLMCYIKRYTCLNHFGQRFILGGAIGWRACGRTAIFAAAAASRMRINYACVRSGVEFPRELLINCRPWPLT